MNRKKRTVNDSDRNSNRDFRVSPDESPVADPDWMLADYPHAGWFSKLRSKAVAWFQKHHRTLPWRTDNSLYRVWVSEIMLQQTQVQTVVDYFQRFMEHFPSIESLANAPEEQVLSLWEGLGYYRRARSLHAAAKQICGEHQSRFPETFEEVIQLPGVGRYTAGAILSIALDQRLPILEGNTYRVFSRLLGLTKDPRERGPEKLLWKFATDLLPGNRSRMSAGTLNQAMMEIGSEVCKVKNPNCLECPLKSICTAFHLGLEKEIPKSSSKTKYEDRRQALFLIENPDQCLLVRQRNPDEWWSGLWDFVRLDVPAGQAQAVRNQMSEDLRSNFGLEVEVPHQPDFSLKHAVTRFRIQLDCYHLRNVASSSVREYQAKPLQEIQRLPLNVTARKALERILKKHPNR